MSLQVWNPCFDVTPGPLIEGIITEEGVVPRDTATGTHRVAAFMAARQQQQNGAAEGRRSVKRGADMGDLPGGVRQAVDLSHT
jgi:hypothetical protein